MAELAKDISARTPVSSEAQGVLLSDNVAPEALAANVGSHRAAIKGSLDKLEVVLALSGPPEIYADRHLRKEFSPIPSQEQFASRYAITRLNPVQKLDYDARLVRGFLIALGPSNRLRQNTGIDATFELARLRDLLARDFGRMPEANKMPEMRYTEALLAEELALLWRPTAPQDAQQFEERHRGIIFNARDPNVLNDLQLDELSPEDAWTIIGARAAEDAEELFRAIAESPTASALQVLEAETRAVDMEVRRLTILANGTHGKTEETQLRLRIEQVCGSDLERVLGFWRKTLGEDEYPRAFLGELMAVAQIRYERCVLFDPTHTVRLALPREDRTSAPMATNRDGDAVTLSTDIIEADANGNVVRTYQVKTGDKNTVRHYTVRRQEEDKRHIKYPRQRTRMTYVTSKDGRPSVTVDYT